VNKAWIEKHIEYLDSVLGGTQFPVFEQLDDFYRKAQNQSRLNELLSDLCKHVGLNSVPEIEVVSDSDIPVLDLQSGSQYFNRTIHSAADIETSSTRKAKIRLGVTQLYRPRNVGRIIAHEITHDFMRFRRIKPSKDFENEMLTDLTAIYVGFGKLLLNGAVDQPVEEITKPIHISKDSLPYLGQPLLCYAYYKCQKLKTASRSKIFDRIEGHYTNTWIKSFKFFDGRKPGIWTQIVAGLRGIQVAPLLDGTEIWDSSWRIDPNRYRIIACIGCSEKLKIPKTELKMTVTCPHCKKEFKVALRS